MQERILHENAHNAPKIQSGSNEGGGISDGSEGAGVVIKRGARGGTSFFTKLDLVSAYHQHRVEGSFREKEAPITEPRLSTVPFGLKNAPALFMRSTNLDCRPIYDTEAQCSEVVSLKIN
jgi:hypothetical protein